jgi:Uma2 family endonuclease
MVLEVPVSSEVIYPESDGKPMADNTQQFRWIVVIKENLEWLFNDNPNVFVAGDLLWYPVEGNNKVRQAPDAMVVFGRPKGDRGSYQQWKEGNIAPHVVFEVLSPGNTRVEMNRKLLFYDRYGVEEYYQYDPESNCLNGWLRNEDFLDVIEDMANWTSPRLGIRFNLSEDELQIIHPNGQPFVSYAEIAQRAERAEKTIQEAIPKLLQMGLSPEQIAEALGRSLEEVQRAIRG